MLRTAEMDIKIARAVRLIREEKGIKQLVVANALTITHSSYCRLESGKRKMTPGELIVIADVFNINVSKILQCSIEEC